VQIALLISYVPDKGIVLDGKSLLWNTDREIVRKLLNNSHKPSDDFISGINMNQRRDIYNNYGGQDNFFFLNYDETNNLSEIEVHFGFQIVVNNITFSFDQDIFKIVTLLKQISSFHKILGDGEYLFVDLKMSISGAESMGGDGNTLSYFYCSKNIDHLLN
jgi:hypothetical protein